MIKSAAKIAAVIFCLPLLVFVVLYFTSENIYQSHEEKEINFKDGISQVYLFKGVTSEIKALSNDYALNIEKLALKDDIGYGGEPFLRCDLALKIKYLNGEEKFLRFYERKPIDDCSIVMSSDGYRHYDGLNLVYKLVSNEGVDFSKVKRSKVLMSR